MLPGDHGCVVYSRDADRRRVLQPYVRAGVQAGERIVYVTDSDLSTALARLCGEDVRMRQCVDTGQIAVLGATTEPEVRIGGMRPLVELLRQLAERAVHEGYAGLRVAADGSALLRLMPALDAGPDRQLADAVSGNRMLALCFYEAGTAHPDEAGAPPVTSRVRLRITIDNPDQEAATIALAGELDRAASSAVTAAIAGLREVRVIRLHMGAVTFLDVGAMSHLVLAARELGAGRELVLVEPPPMVERLLAVAWRGEPMPALRVQPRLTTATGEEFTA
jgi:anti-anti-sigma factor